MDSTPEVLASDDEQPTPPASPVKLRGALWETVLTRSLQSGDAERVAAAIDLAEAGGAGLDFLASARRQLAQLADLSLAQAVAASAETGDDGANKVLRAALERADEAGASASVLYEAQQEMRRNADTRLAKALEALRSSPNVASAGGLRAAINSTVDVGRGVDAELLADARLELARFRAASGAQARDSAGEVVVSITMGPALHDAGWEPQAERERESEGELQRERSRSGAAYEARARLGDGRSKLPRWRSEKAAIPAPCGGVAPTIFGRASCDECFDALESGLFCRLDFDTQQRSIGLRV